MNQSYYILTCTTTCDESHKTINIEEIAGHNSLINILSCHDERIGPFLLDYLNNIHV